jgi:hypothetical protein
MAVKFKKHKAVVVGTSDDPTEDAEVSPEEVEIADSSDDALPEASLASVAKEVVKLEKPVSKSSGFKVKAVLDEKELVNVQMLTTIFPMPSIGPWKASDQLKVSAMVKGHTYSIPRFAAIQLAGSEKMVIIS